MSLSDLIDVSILIIGKERANLTFVIIDSGGGE